MLLRQCQKLVTPFGLTRTGSFCLFFFNLLFAVAANAQDALLKTVSLQLKHVTHPEVLSAIERQAGVRFVYQPSLFQPLKKIDVQSNGERLPLLLNRLLLPLNVRYEISANSFIILTKDDADQRKTFTDAVLNENNRTGIQTTQSVSGKVCSEGIPISGASVVVVGTARGTSTDENGKFELDNLQAGNYTLLFTHVNFSKISRTLSISDRKIFLQIDLPGDPLEMQQVVVTSVGVPKKKIESSIAIATLAAARLEDRSPVNNMDAVRSIPGIFAVSSGGDGPGAVRVRGLPSGGGYQFFGVLEDGLPVLPTGYANIPSADQYYKLDVTVKNIEAIRGGNTPLLMANTPGALMNLISYTGSEQGYGKFKFTKGLSQRQYRADGNFGGSISKKWRYNIGGFYRKDDGIKPPAYTANQGGQLKANLTWHFNGKGFVRLYTKYMDDRVQWQLAGFYPYNKEHRNQPFADFDLYRETLVPSQTRFAVALPDGNVHHTRLDDGYRTIVGYGGLLFQYKNKGWDIRNHFRYQYSKGLINFIIASNAVAFSPTKKYFFADGTPLKNPTGYYANQQTTDNERLESQLIDYVDLTKKFGRYNLTVGGGVHVYNVLRNEGVNAIVNTEIKNKPRVILVDSSTAPAARAASYSTISGQTRYNGITVLSSLYALGELSASERWHLEAGIRIDHFNLHGQKAVFGGASIANGGNGYVITGLSPWENRNVNWSASVAANYKMVEGLALFLRGTLSYSGFTLADFISVDAADLRKRNIVLCEAGTKFTKDRFSLFSAVAYTAAQHLPLAVNVPSIGGSIFIQNTVASSRCLGWETEAGYQFSKGIHLRLNSTLQNPVFTDYVFVVSPNARPELAGKPVDWNGNRPQGIPNLNVIAEGTGSYKSFNLFANAVLIGPAWSTSANTYKVPAFTEMTAGIGTRLLKKKIELRAWSNNLLDARSLTQGNVRGEQFINEKDLVIGQPMLGRALLPRSFWLSASYSL